MTNPLIEAETTIASETEKFNVALEHGPDYAQAVGVIISLFAIVEDYTPFFLKTFCNIDASDARSIMGVFRAFSNRIELLKELSRNRPVGTRDRIISSYYRGLLTDANKIRNKYAHAKYSYAKTHFVLHTFAGDFNRNDEHIYQKIDDFNKDIKQLKRIICELHALFYRSEIPLSLHKQLQKPNL